MKREEAIKHFRDIRDSARSNLGAKHAVGCEGYYRDRIALAETALSALTPPTQEQLERVWKGCEHCTKQRVPFCYDGANDAVYLLVGNGLASIESDSWEFMCSYCPRCGRPLTPEAWEEQRKRLAALNDGKGE